MPQSFVLSRTALLRIVLPRPSHVREASTVSRPDRELTGATPLPPSVSGVRIAAHTTTVTPTSKASRRNCHCSLTRKIQNWIPDETMQALTLLRTAADKQGRPVVRSGQASPATRAAGRRAWPRPPASW
jgi:hypothetical protein